MFNASASLLMLLAAVGVRDPTGPQVVEICTPPTVILDSATVTGLSSEHTNQFLGIPFAQPPTGSLRFQLPQSLSPYNASFSATEYGPSCPQQDIRPPPEMDHPAFNIKYFAEDCLTLNVVTPNTVTPMYKLPVLVWIYGGGFEVGSTSIYDASPIMERAVSLGVPLIYVSINYRVNAFGFLAGQEVKGAGVGNLGLHDQRLALEWIQKYITAFGGDPTKVTIWGGSAGAMSAAIHMVTNGGHPNGLFRAAIMQSGSTFPLEDITQGQSYYDALVAETGCSGAKDTLQCLREVPYKTLLDAVNQSPGFLAYQSIALAWVPRVDGEFLKADPRYFVHQGAVADIPFISGNCEDEGTMFALSTLNVTTDAQFEEYIHTYFVPNAEPADLTQLMSHYPSDPAHGSPFGTGHKHALSPQFKRMAAFQGDFMFEAPRRFFVQKLSGKQSIWTYVSKRMKDASSLGAAHASDLLNVYSGGDMTSYFVRFVTNLDPNVGESTDLYWPQYDATTNETMLELLDGSIPQALTMDTYRTEAMAYLTNLTLTHPSP